MAARRIEKNSTDRIVTIQATPENIKIPVFVGYNGKTYAIKRGIPVRVPYGVAMILQRSEDEDLKTAMKIANLESEALTMATVLN